jgi:3',5'-cyclic AMP phosphodiesterase CpdA
MRDCRVPVIAHISDLHFGAHDKELTETLLVDIASLEPDLTVVSGDLTQRAHGAEFEQARSFLDRLPGRSLTVVGNHDLPLINIPKRLLSGTRGYERNFDFPLDPVASLPGAVVVGLNTMPTWRWKAGHVSSRQVAFVRDSFQNAPPGAWRLLVTHHPVLPERQSALLGRRQLVGACAFAHVTVLLAGHTHVPSLNVVPLGGVGAPSALAAVSGTTISRRTRGTSNSYLVLRLSQMMDIGSEFTVEPRVADEAEWVIDSPARFELTDTGVNQRESF